MTTIAVDPAGVIAADKQETWQTEAGGSSKHRCTKLYRKTVPGEDGTGTEEVIVGLAGATYPGLVFLDWYGTGKDIPDALVHGTEADEDFDAVIVRRSGVYIANRLCRPVKQEDEFIAVGSGRKAAIAAMMCGKTAPEAVQIAAKIDTYTSAEIETAALSNPKPRRFRRPARRLPHAGLASTSPGEEKKPHGP